MKDNDLCYLTASKDRVAAMQADIEEQLQFDAWKERKAKRIEAAEAGAVHHTTEMQAASCSGKFPFPTHKEAQNKLRYVKPEPGGKLHVYKCKFCKMFHAGRTEVFKRPKVPYLPEEDGYTVARNRKNVR
jgi:hypothetical protein